MHIYMAPMESITDVIFRSAHRHAFSGVDKYFIPFISPTQNMLLTPKETYELSPQNNAGLHAVPQLLTKHPEHFLWAARCLYDMGYEEVNLNLGCPSGTVTAKGKGSGMLRDPSSLARFLDDVFANTPIRISIKTRIGYETVEEWDALLRVLSCYPISELIIHPRTRRQFYRGQTHEDAYGAAFQNCHCPIVLNGDIFAPKDCDRLLERFPQACGIMLGRGLIGNPAFARELRGGAPLSYTELRSFHDALSEAYATTGNQMLALVRTRMIAYYMCSCFESPQKPWKAIRKARNHKEYEAAVKCLFEEHAMLPSPHYFLLDE